MGYLYEGGKGTLFICKFLAFKLSGIAGDKFVFMITELVRISIALKTHSSLCTQMK